ncbi:MAG: KamA family radical SAM protein [Deltaproteobacteria bacterium]|nr:KamA family radical SAM protein [Deltaproteobacteria bacterium]
MNWENELDGSIRTIYQLKNHLALSRTEEKKFKHIIERHPMCIPPYYLSLIDKSDPNDPIRQMAVPDVEELNLMGSYDTSGERENTKMPGLQHKYLQTALILSTNRCAMYCRHCFRKRLVGLPNSELLQRFEDAANYISLHEEINNVLITGGDPFVLPTSIIAKFLEMLAPIEHLAFIRFGTRTPVTLPQRIIEDNVLLDLLRKNSLKTRRIYIVTQFNHPKEITPESIEASNLLICNGVPVNNQTVLLKGVNDDPKVLADLQNNLVRVGINPYYVFQCRPVKRVMHHFQVPLSQGYQIVEESKRLLNGHSKRFKYIMSHKTGKIEIVGIKDNQIFLKYHQARNPRDTGKFFSRKFNPQAGWLDDLGDSAAHRLGLHALG